MKSTKKTIAPDLTLNMDDKIYLAVNRDTTGKLAFVYTLACLPLGALEQHQYNGMASREIHTFQDKDSAELYYRTVEKIVEINAMDETKEAIFNMNEKIIERFNQNVR